MFFKVLYTIVNDAIPVYRMFIYLAPFCCATIYPSIALAIINQNVTNSAKRNSAIRKDTALSHHTTAANAAADNHDDTADAPLLVFTRHSSTGRYC